ncbi:myosin-10, partial [Eurytemora carolleeae]|uniref:myosin-10 n=1 Tax=Eurytemora carolleeae TaxID=1294199 RepID=UPI000C7797E1
IDIVEVEEDKESEEKKKKKSGKEKIKKTKSHYEDILEVIRKSPLSDTEAQSVVDILLLKQTGKEENGEDWIEPGKENESKKQARQLSELQTELEEEKSKSGSLEKKLSLLRKELNEGKAVQAGHKREIEELNSKKNQEISSLNSRLQQLTGQLNTSLAQIKQLETNQGHYQVTINNLQAQLSQASTGSDPKLAGELEKLTAARDALTQANSSLEQKLASKTADFDKLAASNQQLTAAKQQLETRAQDLTEELKKAVEEKEKLKQADDQLSGSKLELDNQLSAANNAKQQFDSQLAAVTAAKQQLQLELSVLKDKMADKEGENVRLMEENERLSEQVASSVERPAAEGEEASKVNGHIEVEVNNHKLKEEDVWEIKYNKLSLDFDKM